MENIDTFSIFRDTQDTSRNWTLSSGVLSCCLQCKIIVEFFLISLRLLKPDKVEGRLKKTFKKKTLGI